MEKDFSHITRQKKCEISITGGSMDISNSEHKEIISYLQAHTNIRLRNLTEMPYGDYAWLRNNESEAVERKEIRDFITSKFSGRLVEQLEGCLKEYNKVSVILEGVWGSTQDGKLLIYKKTRSGAYYPDKFFTKIEHKDIIKAILSIRRYVDIIPTTCRESTARTILEMSLGIMDADLSKPIKRRDFPIWTRDEQTIKLMNIVPRLPEKVARELIKRFGCIGKIAEIIITDDSELLEANGVGKGTISNLKKAIWNK